VVEPFPPGAVMGQRRTRVEMNAEQVAYGGRVFVAVEPAQRLRSRIQPNGADSSTQRAVDPIRQGVALIWSRRRLASGRHFHVAYAPRGTGPALRSSQQARFVRGMIEVESGNR